jgi:hypothetical protein
MDTNEARNEVKVMVVIDLATICKKLVENSIVPDHLRAEARDMVEEFDSLLPFRGKGGPEEHMWGEALLIRMARFLPRVLELQSRPADSSGL